MEELQDITLVWNYTLSQGISSSELSNTADVGSPVVIAQWSAGGTTLNPVFKGRFQADISNTLAWLKIIAVKRSDEGKYKFELRSFNFGGNLDHEVEVIVQCKCTIVATCKDNLCSISVFTTNMTLYTFKNLNLLSNSTVVTPLLNEL